MSLYPTDPSFSSNGRSLVLARRIGWCTDFIGAKSCPVDPSSNDVSHAIQLPRRARHALRAKYVPWSVSRVTSAPPQNALRRPAVRARRVARQEEVT